MLKGSLGTDSLNIVKANLTFLQGDGGEGRGGGALYSTIVCTTTTKMFFLV